MAIRFAQDRHYLLTGKTTLPRRLRADEERSFQKSLVR
jgi:hypothetical protein